MRALLVAAMLAGCQFEPGAVPPPGDAAQGIADARPSDTQSADDAVVIAPDANVSLVIEAEDWDSLLTLDGSSQWAPASAFAGFTGSGYAVTAPPSGAPCGLVEFCGAAASYNFTVAVTGEYRVTFRHRSPGNCCDSVFWSIGLITVMEDLDPDSPAQWTDDTSTTTMPLLAGPHVLTVRTREPGARIDHIRIELE